MQRLGCHVLLATLAAFAGGCIDNAATNGASPDATTRDSNSAADLPPTRDSGVDTTPDVAREDAAAHPDLLGACNPAECDDSVSCTIDRCTAEGGCTHEPRNELCDDRTFCNGAERCDPEQGCQAAAQMPCVDDADDFCVQTICDETIDQCVQVARDLDGDGEASMSCPGGTDCDDFNARRASLLAERCSDSVDNDCDMVVDEDEEGDRCVRPLHDTCSDPLDVSAGGIFVFDMRGVANDHEEPEGQLCQTSMPRGEVVMQLELEQPRNVLVRAKAPNDFAHFDLRSDCTDGSSYILCTRFASHFRVFDLAAGTYYIHGGTLNDQLTVEVEIEPAQPQPTNRSCQTAIDVSGGASESGLLGFGGGPGSSLLYTFTLTEPMDVIVSADSDSELELYLEIHDSCPESAGARWLRRAEGRSVATRIRSLPAGQYFIELPDSDLMTMGFTLDVGFEAPSVPRLGESCRNPEPLLLGQPHNDTLFGREADEERWFAWDAVYRFTLSDPMAVTVRLDAAAPMTLVLLEGTCDPDAFIFGAESTSVFSRARTLPAGDYFVVVESLFPLPYTLTIDAESVPNAVGVSGNGSCATAYAVPESGGFFSGDLTSLTNDVESSCAFDTGGREAFFKLVLSERRRLFATSFGTDTFLHVVTLLDSTCDAPESEITCAFEEPIDRTLDPGTYYVVVDGDEASEVGEYLLELLLIEP